MDNETRKREHKELIERLEDMLAIAKEDPNLVNLMLIMIGPLSDGGGVLQVSVSVEDEQTAEEMLKLLSKSGRQRLAEAANMKLRKFTKIQFCIDRIYLIS